MPRAPDEQRDVLQMAGEIRRHGRLDDLGDEGAGGREPAAEEDVRRAQHAKRIAEGGSRKKITRPSQRREMAETAVARRGISIALACRTFGLSETCYRYSPRLSDENEQIADLLIGLTQARKTWGVRPLLPVSAQYPGA
ncbi:hypothetical protein PHAMO_540001 [Magnetospirillum molischianum DSM 120]|uniref:Transposase n=1 Tax=Magnetospirillum molischianum DSM 120 TaxID=1150626 RepID=H8FXB3_MAGML|nr:hypothetical protein PHAMO_540001 [Magnetospirillum molischianum DSM 120]